MAEPTIQNLTEFDWFSCFSIDFHAVPKKEIKKTLSDPERKHELGTLATDEAKTKNFELWEVKVNPEKRIRDTRQKQKNVAEIDNRAKTILREYDINPNSEEGKQWRLQYRLSDRNQRIALKEKLRADFAKQGIFPKRIRQLADRALLFDILNKLFWFEIPITTNEFYWEGELKEE